MSALYMASMSASALSGSTEGAKDSDTSGPTMPRMNGP